MVNYVGCEKNGYLDAAHVLHDAHDAHAAALAEADLLPHVGQRDLLRSGDQDTAVDPDLAEEVHDGDVLVGSARGSYVRAERRAYCR